MKNMLDEFKEFALKGNLVDLAVAFVLGLAFNAVVQSLVNDVLLQMIAAIFGQPDFSDLAIVVGDGADETRIAYGAFLTAVLNFVIVAAALFILVKTMNRLRRPQAADPAPATRNCPYCFSAIPAGATRCSACTSEITPTEPAR